MKRFLFLFAALGFCFSLQAQRYALQTILNGTTNGVSNASSTNYSSGAFAMDVRRQEIAPVLVSFSCGGTNAGFVDFTFERSLDNETYDAKSTWTWRVTANGTNTVTCGTNYTLNGWGFMRLKQINNTNAVSGVTNIVLQYAVKQAS